MRLEVDTDLAAERDRHERQPSGVRQVEAKARARLHERWLAQGAGSERQGGGSDADVAGEDLTQAAVRDDEPAAVGLEDETRGAGPLLGRQEGAHTSDILCRHIEDNAPHIALVSTETEPLVRLGAQERAAWGAPTSSSPRTSSATVLS